MLISVKTPLRKNSVIYCTHYYHPQFDFEISAFRDFEVCNKSKFERDLKIPISQNQQSYLLFFYQPFKINVRHRFIKNVSHLGKPAFFIKAACAGYTFIGIEPD